MFFKSYEERAGKVGEQKAKKVLKDLKGFHLTNFTFYVNEMSVQIDEIVVTRDGIYVVEVKNWSGYVSGSETSKTWHVVTTKGAHYDYKNPLRQNGYHIMMLAKRLPEQWRGALINMILFVNTKRVGMRSITRKKIFQYQDVLLITDVRRYELTDAEMYQIKEVLLKIREHVPLNTHIANITGRKVG